MSRENLSSSAPKPTLAGLPAWAWLGLAAASYAVLRWVAMLPPPPPPSEGEAFLTLLDSLLPARLWAQYVIPLMCLLLAGVCWLRSWAQGTAASTPGSVSAGHLNLNTIGWREFEGFVREGLRRMGYQFIETDARSDAAIDIEMRRERQTHLLHCKHWRAAKVDVDKVQAFHAAMQRQRALGGVMLSKGRYSRKAQSFATGLNIRLIDGPALHALILPLYAAQQERQAHATAEPPPPQQPPVEPATESVRSASRAAALRCPLCEAPMARRKLKRGVNAGQYFMGCTRHPECKGKRPVPAN